MRYRILDAFRGVKSAFYTSINTIKISVHCIRIFQHLKLGAWSSLGKEWKISIKVSYHFPAVSMKQKLNLFYDHKVGEGKEIFCH